MWRDQGLRLLLLSGVLAVVSLVALCLVLLIRTNQNQEFREQATKNCQQINLLKSAIRQVLDESEAEALKRDLDEGRQSFIIEYYARQRARFADDECM